MSLKVVIDGQCKGVLWLTAALILNTDPNTQRKLTWNKRVLYLWIFQPQLSFSQDSFSAEPITIPLKPVQATYKCTLQGIIHYFHCLFTNHFHSLQPHASSPFHSVLHYTLPPDLSSLTAFLCWAIFIIFMLNNKVQSQR